MNKSLPWHHDVVIITRTQLHSTKPVRYQQCYQKRDSGTGGSL